MLTIIHFRLIVNDFQLSLRKHCIQYILLKRIFTQVLSLKVC